MNTKNIEYVKNNISLSFFKNGIPAETRNAWAYSDRIKIRLEASGGLGVTSAEISFRRDSDGGETKAFFEYESGIADSYCTEIFPPQMCADGSGGLFYYTVKICFGSDEAYLSSVNNVDFDVVTNAEYAKPFRLLVYADGAKTPDWAKSAVMYHIFVDRFRKTNNIFPRSDAEINPDWENGIPKFAPYPGAPLDNNEFFGGNLYGIAEKLGYLETLGVNCIYLSPIFKAYSNHKYDTGDYMTIDEMFGGKEAFDNLVKCAESRNIRIILDGVFNHTGSDSLYFNAYGKYPSEGAYRSENSKYHSWYFFKSFPQDYESWWGIEILPKLNLKNPETADFFLGDDGVVKKYLKDGAFGWRLDVADELPQEFLERLRNAVKNENPDAIIIGEVWENAADKIAYGERRKYFRGFQLDSVMNYPLRNAIVNYMRTSDCTEFYNTVSELYSSYPEENACVLMNILGTHDTERILTVLGAENADFALSNADKAKYRLPGEKKEKAVQLLKIASAILYTMPGIPCIFYGDEAGAEGMGDPFCRCPYPWGRESKELREHYAKLGRLKRTSGALCGSRIEFIAADGGYCSYRRSGAEKPLVVCVNMTDASVVCGRKEELSAICGECIFDGDYVCVPPMRFVIAEETRKK